MRSRHSVKVIGAYSLEQHSNLIIGTGADLWEQTELHARIGHRRYRCCDANKCCTLICNNEEKCVDGRKGRRRGGLRGGVRQREGWREDRG